MHPDLHTDLDNLDSVENNLRHSAKGSIDAYDVIITLTGYEPNDTVSNELVDSQGPFSYVTPSSDQDRDDTTLGKLLTEVHREYADYRSPEGVSVSQSSLSVSSDRTGKPVGESSSSAQIRTLLEQRQMIIAEYCEKVSHHEFQAARAEQERQILQEELWRQQKDFREVHQQSLTEMEELRKFQSSTFDTIARRKLIEDQNTIMELSGRLEELQNEVNCMNDSKDFQDAESVRSGNSHVTSQPMLFPKHPIPEGLMRHSFVSPSRREGPPGIWDTHGISGNVFANPHASSQAKFLALTQWDPQLCSSDNPFQNRSRSFFRIVSISVGLYIFNNVAFRSFVSNSIVCISGFIQFFSPISWAYSPK